MRVRSYVSQSFALTIEQIEWLDMKAKEYSSVLGVRVSMSELIRTIIDETRNQQGADTPASAPIVLTIPDQPPHEQSEMI